MDRELGDEFRRFWKEFFDSRLWPHTELANQLNVAADNISKWIHARNAIGPENISKLIENERVDLQSDELTWLMRLYLLHAGFSQKSLSYIENVFASGKVSQPDDSDRPTILAFSPLTSENTSFHSKILQIFTERAVQFNYRVISQSVSTETKLSLYEYYPNLDKVSGVVAISCHIERSNWLEECKKFSIPIVLVHDSIEEDKLQGMGKVSAIWEELNGLRDLVIHLIRAHQCKNMRIVICNPTGRYHRMRKINKIREVADEYGVDIDIDQHVIPINQYTYSEGVRVAQDKILPKNNEVDSVICFYDEVALAIWNTAKSQGRPDLVVTGYDDIDPAEQLGITSISQKRVARANQAFLEILQAQNDPTENYLHTHWMETVLKWRASCGCV